MRDRLILQKIVLYCQRIADNLDRYRHDFSAFEQDYLFQMPAVCASFKSVSWFHSSLMR